jgi:CubicO group peptidase (beta-lactamase class C family)
MPAATTGTAAHTDARVRDTLRAVLDRAVQDSAFPGAIAVVGSHDRVYATVAAGRLDWAAPEVPDDHTLWDLASLTKVVGTLTATMRLVSEGKLQLDAPVRQYLPRWTVPGSEGVTIRNLLLHTAGLPAHRPLYREADAAAARVMLYATPLDTLPGARTVYSDLGLLLLGDVVESLAGERLDRYLQRILFTPLGMTETMYNPPVALWPRTAPTEIDPWRGRHIRGEVHDENAFALGGVAAHAGLFSTAHDMARFARMYLSNGSLDGARILEPGIVSMFTKVADRSFSTRALGWDTANGRNSAGSLMSDQTFGHTGFTGTSMWMDPASDVFVILLTNRVNPTRANNRITSVRRAVADAAVAAMRGRGPEAPRR